MPNTPETPDHTPEEIQTTKIVAGQKPARNNKAKTKQPRTKKRRTLEISIAVGIAAVIIAGAATAPI
ncbi:MAG: hypothetical protein L0G87_01875, partial [Renibacterium salmoninarum]|nr:hypothetical protein [Renibacterium salmoninarum]